MNDIDNNNTMVFLFHHAAGFIGGPGPCASFPIMNTTMYFYPPIPSLFFSLGNIESGVVITATDTDAFTEILTLPARNPADRK